MILKFNGREITRYSELPPVVSELAPGSAASLEIWRKGKIKKSSMNVGEMKNVGGKGKADEQEKDVLGLTVRPLMQDERQAS